MRIVFKKKKGNLGTNKTLMELTGIEPLEKRIKKLKKQCIKRMMNSKNPIINVLIEDYKRFEDETIDNCL